MPWQLPERSLRLAGSRPPKCQLAYGTGQKTTQARPLPRLLRAAPLNPVSPSFNPQPKVIHGKPGFRALF